MPTLYVVATPIGNLEDISFRALRTLREVQLIAAEDTRRTRQLLNVHSIKTPMTSYHEHNKRIKLDYILGRLAEDNVALVSSAGMPGISDPGYELIAAAIEHGFPVVPIPGASTVITALAVSGLPARRFVYLGFIPRRSGERRHMLESIADECGTIVILESPHRLLSTLDDIRHVLGDRKMAICRELTKIHEEVFRGTISQAIDRFAEPRGEFTLVIEGRKERGKPEMTEDIRRQLSLLRLSGKTAREATATLAGKTGLPRKELYQAWLKLS